jgi:4-azaleucine resistance transporter AzlC
LSTGELRAVGVERWRAEFLLGAWQMLPFLVGIIPFGLILGTISADKGLSPLETALMSALVFAGSSQLVAVGLWLHPIPILAIIASTALINARHLLMGGVIAPHMEKFAQGRAYVALFFLADEIWAIALRRSSEALLTPAYYTGLALPLYLSWVFWTTLGNLVGGIIRHPERYGFDFAFTAVFLVILFGYWRRQRKILPIAASAAAALLTWRLFPGVWYVFAGGLAGTAAAAVAARTGQ